MGRWLLVHKACCRVFVVVQAAAVSEEDEGFVENEDPGGDDSIKYNMLNKPILSSTLPKQRTCKANYEMFAPQHYCHIASLFQLCCVRQALDT